METHRISLTDEILWKMKLCCGLCVAAVHERRTFMPSSAGSRRRPWRRSHEKMIEAEQIYELPDIN
jgi:hypothetical protein